MREVKFGLFSITGDYTQALRTAKRADIHGLTDLVGFEEWSYLVIFLWLAVAGAGPLSLDRLVAPRLERLLGKKNAAGETVAA